MLPLSYASRNLFRDPVRFLQKMLGAALVVLIVLAAGSFNAGMNQTLSASGAPENVIFLGVGSEESVERSEVQVAVEGFAQAGVRGIASRLDRAAVSGEVHYMGLLSQPGGQPKQALLRGVTPNAFEVHREVKIIEGGYPGPGEVLVGRLAHMALNMSAEDLQPGAEVIFEGEPLKVAGIFSAPGTVMESEVWLNRSDLMTLTRRDSLSCVVLRMTTPDDYKFADLFVRQRPDLELVAIRESDYYQQLTSFFGPLRSMTWLTAGLIATGAIFGGLNTLYAAFSSRIRELATLQAIGFPRWVLLVSLVQESLLSALPGTLLASFLAVTLLEGIAVPFSFGVFRLELPLGVLGAGLGAGLLLGLIGALPPAWRCLSMPLPSALRAF